MTLRVDLAIWDWSYILGYMQYGVKSLLFYYKGGDILYIFLKSNNFDFGCNELVILRLDILK